MKPRIVRRGNTWVCGDRKVGIGFGDAPEEAYAEWVSRQGWRRVRKIAQLPGAKRTAVNALAATLEKAQAGMIRSVYIGIQWSDDTFCGDWSAMPRKDLTVHLLVAQQNALKEFDQGGEVI